MRPNMDAYDALPPDVREAVGDCLAPWSVEMIAGWVAAGWNEQHIVAELERMDREEHARSVVTGVVPAVHRHADLGYALKAKRTRGPPAIRSRTK